METSGVALDWEIKRIGEARGDQSANRQCGEPRLAFKVGALSCNKRPTFS